MKNIFLTGAFLLTGFGASQAFAGTPINYDIFCYYETRDSGSFEIVVDKANQVVYDISTDNYANKLTKIYHVHEQAYTLKSGTKKIALATNNPSDPFWKNMTSNDFYIDMTLERYNTVTSNAEENYFDVSIRAEHVDMTVSCVHAPGVMTVNE